MTTPASNEAPPRKATHASETASAEAREQADEYQSVFKTTDLALDDGSIIKVPPHPDYGMLDDDAMDAYEELQFRVDTEYDREDDVYIPAQHLLGPDGKPNGIVMPESTNRGPLKRPYRISGQRVSPPHSVQIVKIALGDVDYKRLRAGGRNAGDVWRIWNEQQARVVARRARDSKSNASAVGVAPVSETDSE